MGSPDSLFDGSKHFKHVGSFIDKLLEQKDVKLLYFSDIGRYVNDGFIRIFVGVIGNKIGSDLGKVESGDDGKVGLEVGSRYGSSVDKYVKCGVY